MTMVRAVLFCCTVSVAYTALQNKATFRESLLKYYNGQQDTAIFAAAMLSCYQKGGWLVMPKDRKLNDAVAEVSRGEFAWIGGSDMFGEGKYEWIDGEDVEWSNWNEHNPDNSGNNEDCMNTNAGGSKAWWNDWPCEKTIGYVCQIPDTKASRSEIGELTVYAGQNATSYFRAKRFCQNRRSRLALLHNDDRLEKLVAGTIGSTDYWITQSADIGSCSTVSRYGISTTDCWEPLPFICEQVAPNALLVSDEEPTIEIGSDFKVECTASGVPIPEVKWYEDGIYVPHQKRGSGQSSLVLKNVTAEDAGMYVCKAANKIGGERRNMQGYSFIEVTNILE